MNTERLVNLHRVVEPTTWEPLGRRPVRLWERMIRCSPCPFAPPVPAAIPAALLLVLVPMPCPVSAQEPPVQRVVVVDRDGSLHEALRDALGPWRLEVVPAEVESPGATMPGAADRGVHLADAHDALAAVWISESDSGFAAWVYDARQDRVVARSLSAGPPFDEATAAEVALTVKTLLRHGPVGLPAMSDTEGTEAVAPAEAPGRVVAVPTERRPTTRASTSSEQEVSAQPPSSSRQWSLTAAIGARLWATTVERIEGRFAIGATLWPSSLDRRLGVALTVSSGPGLNVSTPGVAAHFTETALTLALRARMPLGRGFEGGAAAGAGAQLTSFFGTPVGLEQRRTVWRVNPLAWVAAEVAVGLGSRIRAQARAGSSFPLRRQRYLVGETVAMRLERAHLQVMVGTEIDLD